MNVSVLLDFDQRAKEIGRRYALKRSLFEALRSDKGRHISGILGPRGAGKTILLQQLAAQEEDSFYLAADTLEADADLYEIICLLVERYHFKRFFIDEVHFLSDAIGALKRIYDFLEVKLIFTSSVALRIHEAAHDLARRLRLFRLEYFSYAEYLSFCLGESLPLLPLDSLLTGEIQPGHLRSENRFDSYLSGHLMPFALAEPDPLPLLKSTLETIIVKDVPQFLRLHVDELETMRRMLAFIGRSAVDGINYSNVSNNLGITKYKAEQYISALESAFVLQRLFPAGTNVLREPKVLLMPPVRLLYQPMENARGGLREDFFVFAMRQAGYSLRYLKGTRGQKTPDFLLEHNGRRIVFEIGGKGKGRSQFKGLEANQKIILAENISLAEDRIPLHVVGFLANQNA